MVGLLLFDEPGVLMITARKATELDSADLFRWRNDDDTIAASISDGPVEWADHQAWFAASLANDKRWIFIVSRTEDGGSQKLGMCRFDVAPDGSSAEVSINLNPDCRGQGLARDVLTAAIGAFRVASPTMRLTATIRRSNRASEKIFLHAGFLATSSGDEFASYVAEAESC